MNTELVPIKLDKITQTRSYSMLVLKAKNASRFAIYADPQVGRVIQMYLTGALKERPLTHDLISNLFKGLDVKFKQVVINDMKDTIYFAKLFVEQQIGEITKIIEIDARPSDCLAFALLNNVPLYCTSSLLSKTVPITED
ncbi:MAG: bifunctional nuclease domain-containing protein, partial [Chlamydiota bacterium]